MGQFGLAAGDGFEEMPPADLSAEARAISAEVAEVGSVLDELAAVVSQWARAASAPRHRRPNAVPSVGLRPCRNL